MLGNLLSSLLISKFGSFLDGLDPKNVNINVWNGRISYSNLLLKSDYCGNFIREKLNIPVDLKFGQVAQFEINIPWSVLRAFSNPISSSQAIGSQKPKSAALVAECSIIIRNVNILLSSLHPWNDDCNGEISLLTSLTPHQREKRIQEILKKMIQQSEILDFACSNATTANTERLRKDEQSSWRELYLKRLLNNVFSALIIRVEKVHIRFQYESILDKNIFSMGLVFDAFNVTSATNVPPSENPTAQEKVGKNKDEKETSIKVKTGIDDHRVITAVYAVTPRISEYSDHVDEHRSDDSQMSLGEVQCTGGVTGIQKEAILHRFSIYWDTNIVKNTDLHWMDACNLSTDESATVSEKMSAESKYYEGRFNISSNLHMHDHHYLLNPTSISLKLSFKDPFSSAVVHKNGSSTMSGREGYNKILLDVSLFSICINRSMLSDLNSFWVHIKHYYVAMKKAEQSMKKLTDLSDKQNYRHSLPLQFLEYWYKPRLSKQMSSLAKRKECWLWIRSIVLRYRTSSGLFLGSIKLPNYRCWYHLALLLKARQAYGHLYLLSKSIGNRVQEGKTYSREASKESISDIENSLCLTLEEIARWRLYALSVIAPEEQPQGIKPMTSRLFSHYMSAGRLSKFAEGCASTVSENLTEEQSNTPRLELNHIVSKVLEEEQLASSFGDVNSDNLSSTQWQQLSDKLDSLSWKIELKLSSLEIQLHDSMALTQLACQSRKMAHIPILKFGCGSQIEFCSRLNGVWDMNLIVLELEVIDLTSDPLHVRGDLHPLLFGFAKQHQLATSVDNFYGGIHLKIQNRNNLGLDKSVVVSIVAKVCPLEFHYRTSAFETLSRMFSVTFQSNTQPYGLHKAKLALQQFTSRQTKRIKKALIRDGSEMVEDSSFRARDERSKCKFIFDIEVLSPILKYTECSSSTAHSQASSGVEEGSIILSLERLHICNSDRRDHIPAGIIPLSCLTWVVHIADLRISLCGVSVLSPLSADAVFSHLHSLSRPPQHFVAIDIPPIILHISKSFKMLLNRIATDWNKSSRYWANQQLTQKRVEQQTSHLALRHISEDCDTDNIFLSPSPSPTRLANMSFNEGAEEESAKNPSDIHLNSSKMPEREVVLHVSCVAAKISLTLVNDIDYNYTQASLIAVPVIQVIFHAPKITVECCQLKQFHLACVLDDVSIDDTFSGWYNSFFGGETTLQPPTPLLISSLKLDEHTPIATPDPFLAIEYSASNSEESLSISFTKATFINWSPETIAAIQLALQSFCHQTGSVERFFELRDGDYDNEGYENEDFFDANEVLDETVSEFDSKSTPSTLHSSFDDFTYDQLTLEGNNSTGDTYPKQSGFSICIKFDEILINFLKPSNEFLPQMSKLFSASADYMLIRYILRGSNGTRITCDIREFVLRDGCNAKSFVPPSSGCSKNRFSASNVTRPQYYTLYDEILDTRVQNKALQGNQTFLTLSYESFPRTREGIGVDKVEKDKTQIYTLKGQDSSISISFPRFTKIIYFQQLWMEVIDYFFEAIIGSEVIFGKRREHPPDPLMAVKQANRQPSKDIPPHDVSFCKIIINAEDAVVLLPVSYSSPEYLKLSLSFTASNHFNGKICEAESHVDLQWLQWFNNLKLLLSNVRIFNWNGEPLSQETLRNEDQNTCYEGIVRWPIGPTAPLTVPKWDMFIRLGCVELKLFLKQEDYALFQNIVSLNICQESRNYHAWLSWKLEDKNKTGITLVEQIRMVKFGYDVKDAFPSTYTFSLLVPSLTMDLATPSGLHMDTALRGRSNKKNLAARMRCNEFSFSMAKTAEWVSRQKVTLRTIHLMTNFCDVSYQRSCRNSYGMVDLIVPLPAEEDADDSVLDPQPLLLYTSMSNPHSDNVKTLTLSSNCVIDLSNPCSWLSLKKFFSDLPPPVIWNAAQVLGTIRIEDRWYSIDRSTKGLPETAVDEAPEKVNHKGSPLPINCERYTIYQFRLILCSPRLLLGVVQDRNGENMNRNIVIRVDLDYLYSFETSIVKSEALHAFIVKKLWVHTNYSFLSKAVLYTSSLPWSPSIAGSLLVNCANAALSVKSGLTPCSELLMCASIYIGFVIVNLPYSDIGTILEVVDHFTKNIKADSKSHNACTHEQMNLDVMMNIAGLSLLSVDDSCRHFGQVQDLIQLRLGEMNLSIKSDQLNASGNSAKKLTSVFQLQSLNVIDCLQDKQSSFRISLTSTASPDEILNTTSSALLHLEKYEVYPVNFDLIMFCNAPGDLGFVVYDTNDIFRNLCPPNKNFIEVKNENSGDSSSFVVSVGSLIMQWNPSTVIAVQRFLGRANKDFLKRFPKEQGKVSDDLVLSNQINSWNDSHLGRVNEIEQRRLKAALHLETISIILNKEHQGRHLLSISISGLAIQYRVDSFRKLEIFGSVADLCAVDLQQYSSPPGLSIQEENLTLLTVDRHAENSTTLSGVKEDSYLCDPMVRKDFVTFHFWKSKASNELVSLSSADTSSPLPDVDLPLWVLQSAGPVDDFLSATMSSLMFVYLSDRTAELVDYLSNGLPGKGMGRTAAAAKGFFGARIKTRSAMSILVETPVIRIPRHLFSNSFVKVRLGDVNIKSWFEELTFTSAIMTRANGIHDIPTPNCCGPNRFQWSFGNSENDSQKDCTSKSEPNDWWRCLSFTIVNMGFSTSCSVDREIEVPSEECPSSLHVILRKPLWYHSTLVIRSCLSFIQTRLTYSDWALIWLVYEDNLGRKADSSTWDTVRDDPNFIWGEHETDELEQSHPKSLTYSDKARIIRYGMKKDLISKCTIASDEKSINKYDANSLNSDDETILDFKLDLEGINITFRRDDIPTTCSMPPPMILDYDSSRVHVKRLEVELKVTSKGDQHTVLTLFQLDWLDLGNVERLHRQAALGIVDFTAVPSAFTVIAEGSIYSGMADRREPRPPQLAVSVFKPADGIPTASIVLNYLTINALVKPIVETIEFLSCSWHTAEVSSRKICSPSKVESDEEKNIRCVGTKNTNFKELANVEGFNVKLVAHYPQIFLLADEGDPFSRALVFRGLAVIDYLNLRENVASSFLERTDHTSMNFSKDAPEMNDIKCTRSLSAELHSMESYINPDVSEVLGYNHCFQHGKNPPQLGIALIEPLTASLCLSESVRELFPTNRVAKIQIDELSTILSFGDVDLIEKVLRRWLEERRRSSKEYHASHGGSSEYNFVPNPPSTELLTVQAVESDKVFYHSSWEKESIAPNIDSIRAVSFREPQNRSSLQMYDVLFNTEKLGLVLRKKKSAVVVDEILLSDATSCINVGDILYAVAGVPLSPKTPFKMVAKKLESYPRPLSLTFLRPDGEFFSSKAIAEVVSEYSAGNSGVVIQSRQPSTCSILPTQEKQLKLDKDDSYSFPLSGTKNGTFPASNTACSIGDIDVTGAPASLSPSMVYSIQFSVGNANGLRFEHALQGCISFVSGVDQALFASATSTVQHRTYYEDDSPGLKCDAADIEVEHCPDIVVHRKHNSFTDSARVPKVETSIYSNNSIRLPRPGAVLLAINGLKTSGQDFKTIMERLHGATTSADKNQSPTYTLTFAEIPASEWCNLDKITLDVRSLSLTVIDDTNGRDMPLIQASTEKLQFCLDQGLGLPTQMIAVCPPSILNLDSTFLCSREPKSQCSSYENALAVMQCSDASEVIMKVCVESTIGVEYYNPRLALWEPLLEPCRLRCVIERQAGNVKAEPPRPGHLSILITDGESTIADSIIISPNGILSGHAAINLTDAAAEVLFTAVSDWHRRRISLLSVHELMNNDVGGAVKEATRMTSSVNATAKLNVVAAENISSPEDVGLNTSISNRRKATHEVAMVAIKVAKKREGESSGGVAKPFILRNRTGVALNFHLQDAVEEQRFVENNCELRFNINLFDNCKSKSGSMNSSLVRSYGRVQPFLCISLDPKTGISDLITDLPVMKVGQYFRTLRNGRRSILLSWTVDISDNRRVLTLSGSIWVNCLISGVSIEVGVKTKTLESENQKDRESLLEKNYEVLSVGTARPGSPCFLPIWLFQYDAVSVHVRPIHRLLETDSTIETFHEWSTSCLIEYSYSIRSWQPSQQKGEKAQTVLCQPINADFLPSFLHYSVDAHAPFTKDNAAMSNDVNIEASSMMIEVNIASSLTIRNLLPVAIEWEVIGYELSLKEMNRTILLDGSALRAGQKYRYRNTEDSFPTELNGRLESCLLESGQAVDVLSCESQEMCPMARFRTQGCDEKWTKFSRLTFPYSNVATGQKRDCIEDEQVVTDGKGDASSFYIRRRGFQTTVQCLDGCGTPLCIGLRILDRNPMLHRSQCKESVGFGLEVIVFAEIWIKNLTSLPLVFGAPSSHVKSSGHYNRRKTNVNSSGKLMAEAAVLEIASVLDFGELGRDLNLDDNARALGGDLLILPRQQSYVVVEEVFEYIEVESSCVRRRWWASEKHDESRQEPKCIDLPDRREWRWDCVADSDLHGWRIDKSGGVIEGGGWESCNSLVGGSSFNAMRFFDSCHRYRRRRLFRRRFRVVSDADRRETVMFYQPFRPSYDTNPDERKTVDNGLSFLGRSQEDIEVLPRVAIKCEDGRWSSPIFIPSRGISNGLVRVISARWPQLCGKEAEKSSCIDALPKNIYSGNHGIDQSDSSYIYETACLNPSLYELCYQVSTLPGTWGEYSRLLTVSPRYLIRNDSEFFSMDVKQAGASDDTSVRVGIGKVVPFYWSDFRLPELVCIRPVFGDGKRSSLHTGFCDAWEFTDYFKWSGGIDMCDLRMSAIRIRKNPSPSNPFPMLENGNSPIFDATEYAAKRNALRLRTVRARVEIRPGTGGTGVTFSVKDEDYQGEGSLFRIENHTPFPIWVAQNGVLSNPGVTDEDFRISGDLISSKERLSFGLDAPFRQGKHGRVVPYSELYLTRVTLAPLNSRDGVECTKVIGLTSLGSSIRLNPSKLRNTLDEFSITQLLGIRLLGVVCSDGPTRVLRFCVIEKDVSPGNVFGDVMRRQFFDMPRVAGQDRKEESEIRKLIQNAAAHTVSLMTSRRFPSAHEVETGVFYKDVTSEHPDTDTFQPKTLIDSPSKSNVVNDADLIFSFEASLNGFIFSLVDSEPSEIAVLLLSSIEVFAKWNKLRTKDAVIGINVGWLQVDNHCPGAPYPVAVYPEGKMREKVDDNSNEKILNSPFLCIQMAFAPKHSTGISCLRSATISPRDLNISVDLAFLARLQRFLLEVQEHLERALTSIDSASGGNTNDFWPYSDLEEKWPFPNLIDMFKHLDGLSMASSGAGEIYFEGLFVKPCHVRLSIAPSRALSAAEAAKEGAEAAAIHAAVRKGDLDFTSSGDAILGVNIGSRNRTAIQVVRGIFKNILFDALLRCESAIMDFPGVFLQNHITSGPQLSTYMIAHYVAALRSNLPALLGSLAAFGNPVGLIRDLGDGVSDFLSEPIKGFKKSLQELDPMYVVDGVAKGTGSLARHAVGGFADSASMLTETLSKNMAVLTLDRRYAQQRDRTLEGRSEGGFVDGIGSGSIKIVKGVVDGVTGVVRQPIKGAERSGVEGFTKGLGKGLIGLVVKPVIGLSDAATDLMIGVKGSIEKGADVTEKAVQVRPRRVFYGEEKAIRVYNFSDARVAYLLSKIKLVVADKYLSHLDWGEIMAILTTKRLVILSDTGTVKHVLKYSRIKTVRVGSESVNQLAHAAVVHFVLHSSTTLPILCPSCSSAKELCRLVTEAMNLDATRRRQQQNSRR